MTWSDAEIDGGRGVALFRFVRKLGGVVSALPYAVLPIQT